MRFAFIVIYFFTIFIEFSLVWPAIIKAMQNDFYLCFVQCFYLEENIYYAAVIRGVRNVKRNNMKVVVTQYDLVFFVFYFLHSASYTFLLLATHFDAIFLSCALFASISFSFAAIDATLYSFKTAPILVCSTKFAISGKLFTNTGIPAWQ